MKQYDVLTLEFKGKTDGNPFTDYKIEGIFKSNSEEKRVLGFYDGNGIYKIRFMPSVNEKYSYKIFGNFSDEEYNGEFYAEKADSHGMVQADGTYFKYSDGTPYYSIGTTCYAWVNQEKEIQKQTLETLKNSVFNKIRFCIFPKHYDYNYRNPIMFPYEGKPVDNSNINKYNFDEYKADNPENEWFFSKFNTEYFRMIDDDVQALMEMGIEADIILFHSYDRWGFSKMPMWADELYLKYIVARYGAYRNVWWSLANEYDLCSYKTIDDWEHYADIVTENDVYGHLISIHNCMKQYDFSKSWITHCSIQRQAGENEIDFIPMWLKKYNKPIVIDEMCYEGNIEQYWGSISGEEMLRRMWKVYVLGGYPGHSECYFGDNIWWSHGGKLLGESHKRLKFLHDIMAECDKIHQTDYLTVENADKSVKLIYFGEHTPSFKVLKLDDEKYHLDIIDTWNMAVRYVGTVTGTLKINLPQKEYMALKLTKEVE